jgi:hypothetical protein
MGKLIKISDIIENLEKYKKCDIIFKNRELGLWSNIHKKRFRIRHNHYLWLKYPDLELTQKDEEIEENHSINIFISTEKYNEDIGTNQNIQISIISDIGFDLDSDYMFYDDYIKLKRNQKIKEIYDNY